QRLFARSEWALCLVADRRQALEIIRDRACVGLRQSSECSPRHDRGKNSTIGSHTGLNGRDDLVPAPHPEPRLIVRRKVGADERTRGGALEADIRSAEESRGIGLTEKITWRVTVIASAEPDEIFAARD